MRDPYSILGVKRNAEPDEIKAAWRSKAKTEHPDHNQGDPGATGRFTEIGQAYDLLKDPDRRKRYDQAAEMQQTILQQRYAAREAAERAKAAKANAEKVMEELARENAQRAQSQGQAQGQPSGQQANGQPHAQGQAQGHAQGQGQGQPQGQAHGQAQASQKQSQQNQAGANGETPEDMVERIFGAAAADQVRAQNQARANGTGDAAADAAKTDQPGERPPLSAKAVDLLASLVRRFRGTTPPPEKAPDLTFELSVTLEDLLKQNRLTIKLPDEREVRFAIEKGMTNGHVVRLAGQGFKLPGMKPGDLVVTLRLARDMRYRAEGLDLYTTLPISLEDAVLGGEAAIETPEGSRSIEIPAWSGSDQTVRLEGLGLFNEAGTRGDLVVELRIVLWEKPDDKVTDLMRHMRHGLYV